MSQQPGIQGGQPISDAAKLLEAELAETLLASLLGLLACQLKGQRDAGEVLDQLDAGTAAIRFVVETSGRGTQVDAALVRADGGERDLLTLHIQPVAAVRQHQSHTSPVEQLGAVYTALGESSLGSHIPLQARQWLRQSIRDKVRKGGTLDGHAGLSGRGRRDLGAVLDLHNRDAALLLALQAVADGGAAVELWERCKRLAPLVKSFSKNDWPRYFGLPHAPVDWPAWKVALFDAARSAPGATARDCCLPSSPVRLHQIAQANTAFSSNGYGVTVLANHRKPHADDQPNPNIR